MMEKTVMALLVDERSQIAPDIQAVLTRFGSSIRCRIGLHDGSDRETLDTDAADTGLIILQLVSSDHAFDLERALKQVGPVVVQTMTLSME